MKILFPFIISTIAGLSTLLGALVIFFKFKEKNITKFITFSLSFSLTIMIGVSITDLIPNSFFSLIDYYSVYPGLLIILIIFFIGFIIINILSKKIDKVQEKGGLYKLGILSMVILVIHNLPEGIATFISSYQDINVGLKLSIAIMLHNIPEGIAIAVPIYYSTKSKAKAFKYTLFSGFAEPLGAILAYLIFKNYITDNLINIVLLFVASLMITLSIEEILPKARKYNENKFIWYGLVSGITLIIINLLLW